LFLSTGTKRTKSWTGSDGIFFHFGGFIGSAQFM
jgi:hypothetical protein